MKKCLQRLICILVVFCLCNGTALAAGAWVPDPCSLLDAAGELQGIQQGNDGQDYLFYAYFPTMTWEEMLEAMSRYELAMESLGYEMFMPEIQTEFGLLWFVYVLGDEAVEIIFDAAETVDYENLSAEGEILWQLILAIPESASFVLGRGVPGVTKDGQDICKLCNGSGRCSNCSGRGGYYMGKVYHICGACNGSKNCNMCDGIGVYAY